MNNKYEIVHVIFKWVIYLILFALAVMLADTLL